MYTVREAALQNFHGTLQRVAELGYTGVELAGGYPGIGLVNTAAEISQMLKELGLKCISAHVSLSDLRNNLSREIDTYLTMGAKFLVCPWLSPEFRDDESSYHTLAADLNGIGERCRANGLQLCYHHHDFEFVQFNGKYALDILLEESDSANLQLEADTYWIEAGGNNPASYIRRWPGRVPLLHLKDMTTTVPATFAEVGNGILDWTDIFEAAQIGKTEWYIVEQDSCPGDPFESLKLSLENLRHMTS